MGELGETEAAVVMLQQELRAKGRNDRVAAAVTESARACRYFLS